MKKLTQADFKDAPDWVESAAVDSFGDTYLYSERASDIIHDDTHNFPDQYTHNYKDIFVGKSDLTDWQNSAIDREVF